MRKLIFTVAMVFIAAIFLGGTCELYAQNGDSVALDDFIQAAIDHNPKIQEAFHYWKAQEHKIKRVKSLDDQMVSYG